MRNEREPGTVPEGPERRGGIGGGRRGGLGVVVEVG